MLQRAWGLALCAMQFQLPMSTVGLLSGVSPGSSPRAEADPQQKLRVFLPGVAQNQSPYMLGILWSFPYTLQS